ncbi:Hypothetical protein, putative, partial [Bodo saltans]
MLSQADYLSSRPRQGQALPNTWGHLMAETSSNLSVRYEDRDTQLTADDSALQRRAARMNTMSQKYHATKYNKSVDGSAPDRGFAGAAAPSFLTSSAVSAVDVVDAWGYYHNNNSNQRGGGQHPSSDDDDDGDDTMMTRTTPRGIGRAQRRSKQHHQQSTPSDSVGGALRWRDTPPRTSLQTPNHNGQSSSQVAAVRSRGLLTPP